METNLPEELKSLDNCIIIPLDKFISGIYFLYEDNKLMYIGQATNVIGRISEHLKKKNFDKCYFMPCEKEFLSLYENSLIKYFRPPLNKFVARMSLKECNDVVCKLLKLSKNNKEKFTLAESPQRFINSKEATKILGVSMKVLKRLTDFGDIKIYRDWEFGRPKYNHNELQVAREMFSILPISILNEN